MRLYVFDVESGLVVPGLAAPPLACVSVARDDGAVRLYDAQRGVQWLRERLSDLESHFVGHHIAYDFAVCAAKDPTLLPLIFKAYDEDRVSCTLIREKLAAIAQGTLKWNEDDEGTSRASFALEVLVLKYFGHKMDKSTWRLGYGELINVPLEQWPEGAKAYAMDDAVWPMRLWTTQHEKYAHLGYLGDEMRQVRAAFCCQLMSTWGLKTDPKAIAELRAHLDRRKADLFGQLLADRLISSDGKRSMQRIKGIVLEFYGEARAPRTDKGNIKTDEDTLKATADPRLERVLDYAHVQKLASTYLSRLDEGTVHPINPKYNSLVESGRPSASDPNVFNPPREPGVRECYVPRAGFVFSDADYKYLELCTLAQACKDILGYSVLGDTINAGKDPHLWFASMLLDLPYEEVERRKDEPHIDEMRQFSKIANFGYPGGLAAAGFIEYARGYGVIVSLERAQFLRDAWFKAWPEMHGYFKHIKNDILRGRDEGDVVQLRSGRIRRVGGAYTDKSAYTQAANTYFQGLAADGAKAAFWRIMYECYVDETSPLYGCRVVLFLYDQFVLEVPEWKAHEAAMRQGQIMVEEMQKWVPDVKISVDPALMLRWFKKAKAVYQNGRLVPWTPKPKKEAA